MGITSLISYLLDNSSSYFNITPGQQTEIQLYHLVGTIQYKET